LEKTINIKVFTILRFVSRYSKTLWNLLFFPRKTFTILGSSFNSNYMKPGAFLVINIILSYLVSQLLGYTIPAFPFEIPFLSNRFGSYSFLVLRFILGLFLFLAIVKFLIRHESFEKYISLIFPIFCYSSAIYIPFVVVKGFRNHILQKKFLNLLGAAHLKFSSLFSLNLLFALVISLILLLWWLWLIYTGIRYSKLFTRLKLKKIILFAYIIFLTCQILLVYCLINSWW